MPLHGTWPHTSSAELSVEGQHYILGAMTIKINNRNFNIVIVINSFTTTIITIQAWVVIRRVRSRIITVISFVRGLKSPLTVY